MSYDGLKEEQLVGGHIFSKIKSDPRVTKDLNQCLYCEVKNEIGGLLNYKITLDCINGNNIKQCPACKRIYILKDPTE